MSDAANATPRRSIHLRRITCEAFERDDGLFDIEALLIDTKPVSVRLVTNKDVSAGTPIHRMRVRLTVNRERLIVEANAYSEESPYQECEGAEDAYHKLVGLRVGPGFTREVKRLFRGEVGCTHITELLPLLASTVFQAFWDKPTFDPTHPTRSSGQSMPVGTCHALRLDGQIVRTYFPTNNKDS